MKITIVTPNFNYAEYISHTIQSVINQGYPDWEHIIVDDGSTDNSVEIVKGFQNSYPDNIRLIQQENQGQTNAINKGLKVVRGDIIGWINSDDTFCPDVFSEIARYFKANPEVDIVFSDINIVDLDIKKIYRKRFLNFNRMFGKLFGFTNIMSSNAVFFRTQLLSETGLPDESLVCNMDGEFFSRLTGKRIVKKIPIPIANFRRQPFTKASKKIEDWNYVVKKEYEIELIQSYETLAISRIIPYRCAFVIKICFRIYRIILRTLLLHYFMETFEKIKYRVSK